MLVQFIKFPAVLADDVMPATLQRSLVETWEDMYVYYLYPPKISLIPDAS